MQFRKTDTLNIQQILESKAPLIQTPAPKIETVKKCLSELQKLHLLSDSKDKCSIADETSHWSDTQSWDNGRNVEIFFNLMELHLTNHKIEAEKAQAIINMVPRLEYVLTKPNVAKRAIAFLESGFLEGKAERFFNILKAYGALEAIFPFLNDTTLSQNVSIRRFLEKTDETYRDSEITFQVVPPSLDDLVLGLVSASVIDHQAGKVDTSVSKSKILGLIHGNQLLREIFISKTNFNKEKFESEITMAIQERPEMESKASSPILRDLFTPFASVPLITEYAQPKAIAFLHTLKNSSDESHSGFYYYFARGLISDGVSEKTTPRAQFLFALNALALGQKTQAVFMLKNLAEKNYCPAQCGYAGILKASGKLNDAITWYSRAAEAGFHDAYISLSECYSAKSTNALVNLKRAADTGSSVAQYKVAEWSAHAYENCFQQSQRKDIAPVNAEQARQEATFSIEYSKKYYVLAANQGCLLSKRRLDVLAEKGDEFELDIFKLQEQINTLFDQALELYKEGQISKAMPRFYAVAGKVHQLSVASPTSVTPSIDLQDKLTNFLITFPKKDYPSVTNAIEIYESMCSGRENVRQFGLR